MKSVNLKLLLLLSFGLFRQVSSVLNVNCFGKGDDSCKDLVIDTNGRGFSAATELICENGGCVDTGITIVNSNGQSNTASIQCRGRNACSGSTLILKDSDFGSGERHMQCTADASFDTCPSQIILQNSALTLYCTSEGNCKGLAVFVDSHSSFELVDNALNGRICADGIGTAKNVCQITVQSGGQLYIDTFTGIDDGFIVVKNQLDDAHNSEPLPQATTPPLLFMTSEPMTTTTNKGSNGGNGSSNHNLWVIVSGVLFGVLFGVASIFAYFVYLQKNKRFSKKKRATSWWVPGAPEPGGEELTVPLMKPDIGDHISGPNEEVPEAVGDLLGVDQMPQLRVGEVSRVSIASQMVRYGEQSYVVDSAGALIGVEIDRLEVGDLRQNLKRQGLGAFSQTPGVGLAVRFRKEGAPQNCDSSDDDLDLMDGTMHTPLGGERVDGEEEDAANDQHDAVELASDCKVTAGSGSVEVVVVEIEEDDFVGEVVVSARGKAEEEEVEDMGVDTVVTVGQKQNDVQRDAVADDELEDELMYMSMPKASEVVTAAE